MNREKINVTRITIHKNEKTGKSEVFFLDWVLYYDQIDSYGEWIIGDGEKSNCVLINLKSGKSIIITGEFEKYQTLINKYDGHIHKQIKTTVLN